MSQANMRGRGRGSGPTHRPTIKDVASKARVSVGTVSRVLNGNKSVGADIKARVEQAIAQLDYQPDAVAQGMRSGSTRSVGFIIRDITVPALAAFVKAAQAVCHDAGYTLVIGCSDDRPKREVELLEALRRRVDGLIMTTASEEKPELNAVRNALDIPLVLMDREASGNVDSVTIAQREGMYRAVKYLLSLGHRRIALVTGATDVLSSRERVQGYKDAYAELGVAVDSRVDPHSQLHRRFRVHGRLGAIAGAQPADRCGRGRHCHADGHPAGDLDRAAAHPAGHLRHRRRRFRAGRADQAAGDRGPLELQCGRRGRRQAGYRPHSRPIAAAAPAALPDRTHHPQVVRATKEDGEAAVVSCPP